jgi:hypothetical protein
MLYQRRGLVTELSDVNDIQIQKGVEVIKTFNVNSKILLQSFDGHDEIKDKLLDLINSQENESIKHPRLRPEAKYGDNVTRLDWTQSQNFNRPWVEHFLPHFERNYDKFVDELGFKGFQLKDMWFQQYEKDDTHGWHIHGENYTGVYYLEMPTGPKTQILNDGEITDLQVQEGDIVIFPSFLVHRAPVVSDNNRKTIISFNVCFLGTERKDEDDIILQDAMDGFFDLMNGNNA